ncbi:MAG: hypothetical protein IJR59_02170 [Firmicutes bacterium]|nr:hypothetical protein [Bacillota bacterium]
MALSNLGIVDATSISDEQKRVILTIVDDISWDTDPDEKKKHIKMIETKINNYFKYITSGQVLNNYPESVGYGVAIVIQCKYPITRKVQEIYGKIAEQFKQRDILFGYFVEPQADEVKQSEQKETDKKEGEDKK